MLSLDLPGRSLLRGLGVIRKPIGFRYAWLIEEMRPLPAPVAAKGSLGLWEWEPDEALKKFLAAGDMKRV